MVESTEKILRERISALEAENLRLRASYDWMSNNYTWVWKFVRERILG